MVVLAANAKLNRRLFLLGNCVLCVVVGKRLAVVLNGRLSSLLG